MGERESELLVISPDTEDETYASIDIDTNLLIFILHLYELSKGIEEKMNLIKIFIFISRIK